MHLFGCVRVCVNACEGVAYNTDMISEHWPALGGFAYRQSVSQSADDEMQIATESNTVNVSMCVVHTHVEAFA